jgi:hypothetical protein
MTVGRSLALFVSAEAAHNDDERTFGLNLERRRSPPSQPSPPSSSPPVSGSTREGSLRSPAASSATSVDAASRRGWWWAGPAAARGIVDVAAREGIEHLRADSVDDCC